MSQSQCDAILELLLSGEAISDLEALNNPEIKSRRLAARIWQLRHERNIDIADRWLDLPSGKRVKEYFIKPKPQFPIEPTGQARMFA